MDIQVARGTPWLSLGVALALVAASCAGASANRLDKAACADLNTELSGLLVPGLKEDMDKGPAWAVANLSPERLATINRVIELQGVLEFRCGNPPRNIAKPDTKPDDKAPAEKPGASKAATVKPNNDNDEATPAKPQQKTKTMRRRRGSAANPEPPAVVPAAAQPGTAAAPPAAAAAKAASEPSAPTKTEPVPEKPATSASSMTPPAKVVPVSTAPATATVAAEINKAVPAPVTAPAAAAGTSMGAPKTAKKKPSRRDSTSAYVSPGDVNTYGLTYGLPTGR